MRFNELCEKEVINSNDCCRLGCVSDVEFDADCGRICSIIVPGPGKYLGIFCKDYEYVIPWCRIVCIGPDIILVDLDDCTMKKKL